MYGFINAKIDELSDKEGWCRNDPADDLISVDDIALPAGLFLCKLYKYCLIAYMRRGIIGYELFTIKKWREIILRGYRVRQ